MAGHGGITHAHSTSSATPLHDRRAWFDYLCGHCGREVSGAVLAWTFDKSAEPVERWTRCTSCGMGSYISAEGVAFPGPKIGRSVDGLPENVRDSYNEARRCAEVNAFTACEMMCRKILMHIAVDKGASGNNTFKGFVDYLEDNHHVTPAMKPWVDVIRKHGNIAVHELPHTDRDRAIGTLTFTEHLLRNVYEMEHLARLFAPAEVTSDSGDDAHSEASSS